MVAQFRSNLMVRDEHILVKKLHSHIAKDFLDERRNVPRISWRLDEIVFAPRFKPVVIRRKHRGRAIDMIISSFMLFRIVGHDFAQLNTYHSKIYTRYLPNLNVKISRVKIKTFCVFFLRFLSKRKQKSLKLSSLIYRSS